jgi:hypothetical protein
LSATGQPWTVVNLAKERAFPLEPFNGRSLWVAYEKISDPHIPGNKKHARAMTQSTAFIVHRIFVLQVALPEVFRSTRQQP